MASVAYALPIRQGKSQAARDFEAEVNGARKGEHDAQRRAHGFNAIRVWHQRQPQEMVVVYVEADNLDQALNNHATSNSQFDQWFKQQVQDITGQSLSQFSSTPSDLVLDWHH